MRRNVAKRKLHAGRHVSRVCLLRNRDLASALESVPYTSVLGRWGTTASYSMKIRPFIKGNLDCWPLIG